MSPLDPPAYDVRPAAAPAAGPTGPASPVGPAPRDPRSAASAGSSAASNRINLSTVTTSTPTVPFHAHPASAASAAAAAAPPLNRPAAAAAPPPDPRFDPPVSKASLSELEVGRMVFAPKLRHDINFDPDLCFRPNTDGPKGHAKQLKAQLFWDVLLYQLTAFMADPDAFERAHPPLHWNLPAFLTAVREIIAVLIPPRDYPAVEETFDVAHLMRQFRMGAANLDALVVWLADVLKAHCAPMRDDEVDDWVALFRAPPHAGTPTGIMRGLRRLSTLLEQMKLDIANHQVRCLRPLLVEDTVFFQQRFFMRRIALGTLNVFAAHEWYKRTIQLCHGPPDDPVIAAAAAEPPVPARDRDLWNFLTIVLRMIMPRLHREPWPHTFQFDDERLLRLRHEILDLTNLHVCLVLHRGLDRRGRLRDSQVRMPDELVALSPRNASPVGPAEAEAERNPVAGELPPAPASRTLAAEPTGGARPTGGAGDDELSLRTSLQSILSAHTGVGPERWTTAGSSLALQMLRSRSVALTRLPQLESRLAFHLSNPESVVYQEAEAHVVPRLVTALRSLLDAYKEYTLSKMFDVAMTPSPSPSGTTSSEREREELESVAMRLTHMTVVHWRIWSPVTYLVDPAIIARDGRIRLAAEAAHEADSED